jgi:hypothetical protein
MWSGRSFLMLLITLMMEAESTSEMSVNFYRTTWRNIPEDSHLRIHRRENLKSRVPLFFCCEIKNPHIFYVLYSYI